MGNARRLRPIIGQSQRFAFLPGNQQHPPVNHIKIGEYGWRETTGEKIPGANPGRNLVRLVQLGEQESFAQINGMKVQNLPARPSHCPHFIQKSPGKRQIALGQRNPNLDEQGAKHRARLSVAFRLLQGLVADNIGVFKVALIVMLFGLHDIFRAGTMIGSHPVIQRHGRKYFLNFLPQAARFPVKHIQNGGRSHRPRRIMVA